MQYCMHETTLDPSDALHVSVYPAFRTADPYRRKILLSSFWRIALCDVIAYEIIAWHKISIYANKILLDVGCNRMLAIKNNDV